ncbi:ABC transporter permease subunit [Peribacillus sp. NPDC097198]|uniref:ABC transporter permease subunit n=1 Tax=Peribacillus sp. NPDC097198 TaxID=3364397 RepID=UPI0038280A59
MNNFLVLVKKEFVQMIREYKVVWLPIVFIFLGATQPVLTYYLPSILEEIGGGQGITIDPNLANQKGGEVLASTVGSQFDQLGLMVLVISMMGIIQSDKENGMLSFILTRPVSVISYITGKLASYYLIAAFSVAIGYLTSFLYVNFLFTDVPFSQMISGLLFYLVWILFIVAFTTMISTIFSSQGIIALISIVVLIGYRLIVGLSPLIDQFNPASMSIHAMETLIVESVNSNVLGNLLVTLLWIFLILFVMIYWIDKKKFNHE